MKPNDPFMETTWPVKIWLGIGYLGRNARSPGNLPLRFSRKNYSDSLRRPDIKSARLNDGNFAEDLHELSDAYLSMSAMKPCLDGGGRMRSTQTNCNGVAGYLVNCSACSPKPRASFTASSPSRDRLIKLALSLFSSSRWFRSAATSCIAFGHAGKSSCVKGAAHG